MNKQYLECVLRQHRAGFLAHFPEVTDQDLRLILVGPSEMLLAVLESRYGYSRMQAKMAWNDFVLREVDGASSDASDPPSDRISLTQGDGRRTRRRKRIEPWTWAPRVRYDQ